MYAEKITHGCRTGDLSISILPSGEAILISGTEQLAMVERARREKRQL
jgi:hypothetical protein